MTKTNDNKLGLYALIAMCIGSMIGSGLFDLPQNVAATTGVAASMIGWTITFFGMICLAKVFQNLSDRCPELDTGVYSYAKEGLGTYVGFSSAWGYWFSAWLTNIGYSIILCSALSLFFPIFGDGTNLPSLILSSIIMWSITILCIRGIKSATIINTITTIAKIIPVIIFIGIIAVKFNYHTFTADIWQKTSLGTITSQVKNMMLITVWVFIGIEGANVFSSRAKNRADVGKATMLSFIIVFLVLFVVSILPFGILPQAELASLKKPATGALLSVIAGKYGNAFMNIGLIISALGAFLAWFLISAEVPYVAGLKDRLFPRIFTTKNKFRSPQGSLIITGISQQLYLFIVYFYKSGYITTVLLATTMILLPYLFSAIYAIMIAIAGKKYSAAETKERKRDLWISSIAVAYGFWVLYAAGIKYLLLSSAFYSVGSILFIITRKQQRQKIFNKYELALFLIMSILGITCTIALSLNKITL